MKIDIQVEDLKKYASIAFLVDREDFSKDIEDVREKIKLHELPYIFPIFPYSEANRLVEFYKKGQISINGTREMLEEFCREENILNLYALDNVLGSAVIFAKSLTKKYRKNRLYLPVVLASILIAQVKEEDFLSTQMFTINHKSINEELKLLDKDEEIVTISVNRESKSEEVKQIFDFIQKYYFKTKPSKDSDQLRSIYDSIPDTKVPDKANNIIRDRDWYWLKKEGWSYQKIKNHYQSKKYPIISRGIELAIKRYADNLK